MQLIRHLFISHRCAEIAQDNAAHRDLSLNMWNIEIAVPTPIALVVSTCISNDRDANLVKVCCDA